MDEVDDVVRRVNAGEPMSAPDLRRAAELLNRHTGCGRPDLAAARVRVAVLLERLGE
ncbi:MULTISPECIES: hypothetical protein [unclassified Geodermatophilus]|uniref:hypothetical protein n=1 Tax=unclassified Geodermatophilus TaxID=2637632 RepID=UPI003EEE06A1